MENQIESSKSMLKIAGIIAIVGSIIAMFYAFLLPGIASLIFSILLLNYGKLSSSEFLKKKNTILFFGIWLLPFGSIIGGILVLIAWSKIPSENEATQTNMMSLEKAFELKEKGAISEEEFNRIKNNSLK